jgi:type IV secretory pathway protease TraF
MLDSILAYLGFAIILVGLLSILWPLRFLRIRTRLVAAIVTASGLLMAIAALSLPVQEKHVSTSATKLDEWMPTWQFDEQHAIHVDAPPGKVFAAIRDVRANEILFFER